jgi:hypothetical protein
MVYHAPGWSIIVPAAMEVAFSQLLPRHLPLLARIFAILATFCMKHTTITPWRHNCMFKYVPL